MESRPNSKEAPVSVRRKNTGHWATIRMTPDLMAKLDGLAEEGRAIGHTTSRGDVVRELVLLGLAAKGR